MLSDHRLGRVLCTMWSQTRYDLAECWNNLLDIWILLARGLGESVKFLAVWLWPSGPNEKREDKSVSQRSANESANGWCLSPCPVRYAHSYEVGNLDFCPLSPRRSLLTKMPTVCVRRLAATESCPLGTQDESVCQAHAAGPCGGCRPRNAVAPNAARHRLQRAFRNKRSARQKTRYMQESRTAVWYRDMLTDVGRRRVDSVDSVHSGHRCDESMRDTITDEHAKRTLKCVVPTRAVRVLTPHVRGGHREGAAVAAL